MVEGGVEAQNGRDMADRVLQWRGVYYFVAEIIQELKLLTGLKAKSSLDVIGPPLMANLKSVFSG